MAGGDHIDWHMMCANQPNGISRLEKPIVSMKFLQPCRFPGLLFLSTAPLISHGHSPPGPLFYGEKFNDVWSEDTRHCPGCPPPITAIKSLTLSKISNFGSWAFWITSLPQL